MQIVLSEFDDDTVVNDDGCQASCTATPPGACGARIVDWDELYDDGNEVNTDGCEDNCTPTMTMSASSPRTTSPATATPSRPSRPRPGLQRQHSESVLISNTVFTDNAANSWEVAKGFGSDKIWSKFKTLAPPGAEGYSIDFSFHSSEGPVYVDKTFNDLFVAWAVADDFTGSISTIDGLATTITALHPHWSDLAIGFPKNCDNFGSAGLGVGCNEPQLAGTGFEGRADTTWVRINERVDEGQTLELYFFLADMGDTALTSAVLLDRPLELRGMYPLRLARVDRRGPRPQLPRVVIPS